MIGKRVRHRREELGLTGAQLAARAGMAPSAVSQIETGKRTPSSTSVVKLASALNMEVASLFPKEQAPLPEFDQEQRRSIPETLSSYMGRRAKSLEAELKDESSPHFKNATTATIWVAGVQQEAKDWADWAAENWSVITPQRSGFLDKNTWLDAINIMGHLMTFNAITRKAERRIAAMNDQPDDLARKRLDKERREAQESERRLQELQAASG